MGFEHLSDTKGYDAIWTAEKKCPLCICLKQADVRIKTDFFVLRRAFILQLSDEYESVSAFRVLKLELRRNDD